MHARYGASRTAITRRHPSWPAVHVVAPLVTSASSILDWGCGLGRDVEFYRSLHGVTRAEGFDPHPTFGFSEVPDGVFDVVAVTFVVNVLSSPTERHEMLTAAAAKVAPHGVLVVSSRSAREVNSYASKQGWARFSDGFTTSAGTFQRGFTRGDLECVAYFSGFAPLPVPAQPSRLTTVAYHRTPTIT